jgi:hypothetical protein
VNIVSLGVARYRLAATFRQRWPGYLAMVLLVGLLGGLSMAAVAGGRATAASFSQFFASTNPPDLEGGILVFNPAAGSNSGYSAARVAAIGHLPLVRRVGAQVELNMGPVTPTGEPVASSAGVAPIGTLDGLGYSMDRIIVQHGRLPDPSRPDEFAMDASTAALEGLHLGEYVTMGVYSNAELENFPNISATSGPKPYRTVRMHLVGVGTVQVTTAVDDDVDSQNNSLVIVSPGFVRPYLNCCTEDTEVALQLTGGASADGRVKSELAHAFPDLPISFESLSGIPARAQQSITPEALALGAFGALSALALLVIAIQMISRQLRLNADDLDVLRALGASPQVTVTDGLVGIVFAIVGGALLAVMVAIGLSPLAPIGPVRQYLPIGVHADWTVLGAGLGLLVVLLGAGALALALREAPQRVAARSGRPERTSSIVSAAAAGLPASAATGVRFALEPGSGRRSVPVRAVILGAVVAVIVVAATSVFGSSLNSLVSQPRLYGWNFSFEINGGDGLGDIPNNHGQAATLLNRDKDVGSWTGVYFSTERIGGLTVAVMGQRTDPPIGPHILTGHGLSGTNQIVLGTGTLDQLHAHLGQVVTVRPAGAGPVRHLTVVGTATLPAIGVGGSLHLEIGDGAIVPYEIIPPAARNIFSVTPGPNAILVRDAPGVSAAAARHSLVRIGQQLQIAGNGGAIDGVERPAEIINYRSLGMTPVVLGAVLAGGAVLALGLTLFTSVRRRRRDLALLKTLGFTQRQLAATIAWQSLVAVTIGTAAGIPLGIAGGRFLWDLFATEVHFVPQATVSLVSVAVIAIGALGLALVVAIVPARIAARTHTAVLLRTE